LTAISCHPELEDVISFSGKGRDQDFSYLPYSSPGKSCDLLLRIGIFSPDFTQAIFTHDFTQKSGQIRISIRLPL